jgi:hypothetical protein
MHKDQSKIGNTSNRSKQIIKLNSIKMSTSYHNNITHESVNKINEKNEINNNTRANRRGQSTSFMLK